MVLPVTNGCSVLVLGAGVLSEWMGDPFLPDTRAAAAFAMLWRYGEGWWAAQQRPRAMCHHQQNRRHRALGNLWAQEPRCTVEKEENEATPVMEFNAEPAPPRSFPGVEDSQRQWWMHRQFSL